MDGFLNKPFSAEDLRTAVQRHARPASARAEPSPPVSRRAASKEELSRTHFPAFWRTCLLKRNEMQKAIEADDAGGLLFAAHAVMGSAAIFGLPGLSTLAGELEDLGRGGTLGTAAEVFQRLDEEFEAVAARRQA